jgi:tetratricopeptide (TPR) repeat protein
MQTEDVEVALRHLKKAEFVASDGSGWIADEDLRSKLLAATFNNFGCLYRKQGKLKLALKYLRKALNLEESHHSRKKSSQAATYLNICVILSQMGKHERALVYATGALYQLGNSNDKNKSLLAVTHHNIAVEYEFLFEYETSVYHYTKASEIAEQDFGKNHPMTLSINNSKEKAEAKLAKSTKEPIPIIAPKAISAPVPTKPRLAKAESNGKFSRSSSTSSIVPQPPRGPSRKPMLNSAPVRKYVPPRTALTPQNASILIQKIYRGFICRKELRIQRVLRMSYEVYGKNLPSKFGTSFLKQEKRNQQHVQNVLEQMRLTLNSLSLKTNKIKS